MFSKGTEQMDSLIGVVHEADGGEEPDDEDDGQKDFPLPDPIGVGRLNVIRVEDGRLVEVVHR